MNLDVILKFILLAASVTAIPHCTKVKEDLKKCLLEVHCLQSITPDVKVPAQCDKGRHHIKLSLTLINDTFKPTENLTLYLSEVEELNAYSNDWPKINQVFTYLREAKRIFLIDNKITKFGNSPFKHAKKLLHLDLSYNALKEIEYSDFVIKPKNYLQYLKLSHNMLKVIKTDTFRDMHDLIYLDLSFNFLNDLNCNTFHGIGHLKVLRLNNNKISHLNGALLVLNELKQVYLQENKFVTFEIKEIPNFIALSTFDISKNNLTSVHPEVFTHLVPFDNATTNSKIVQSINFSLNKLSILNNASVPVSVQRSRRDNNVMLEDPVTTDIYLSNNEIEIVEFNAFQGVARLRILDLSSNHIQYFSINPVNLDFLRELNLSYNKIKNIHIDSFYYIKRLKNLDLSYNKIDYYPKLQFQGVEDLANINLQGNMITEILKFEHECLNNPLSLDLSRNMLTQVSMSKGLCKGMNKLNLKENKIHNISMLNLNWQNELEYLDISVNQLSSLNNASLQLQKLKHFDLSYNHIKTLGFSAFRNLTSLQRLILSHNQIQKIEPGTFQGLNKLTHLDLSNNRIVTLESGNLFELKSLELLNIERNNMKHIDLKAWLGKRVPIEIYVGGNNFKCHWLATILRSQPLGWLGVRLLTKHKVAVSSIDGIACSSDDGQKAELVLSDHNDDEMLLLTAHQILDAIKIQNKYLLRTVRNLDWLSKGPLARLMLRS